MKNCIHCYNENKPASYKVSGTNSDSYFCSKHIKSDFVRKHYSTGTVEYIGNRIRRYNLPLDHKYRLVNIEYMGGLENFATTCQNCNAIITNIATIKNELDNEYMVGVDCATTLGFTDITDFWKLIEIEAKMKKDIRLASTIRKLENVRISKNENYGIVYTNNRPYYQVSTDFINKYLPNLL